MYEKLQNFMKKLDEQHLLSFQLWKTIDNWHVLISLMIESKNILVRARHALNNKKRKKIPYWILENDIRIAKIEIISKTPFVEFKFVRNSSKELLSFFFTILFWYNTQKVKRATSFYFSNKNQKIKKYSIIIIELTL